MKVKKKLRRFLKKPNILTSVSFFDNVLSSQEHGGHIPRRAWTLSFFLPFFRYPPGSLDELRASMVFNIESLFILRG
jgi:hypothetical protein